MANSGPNTNGSQFYILFKKSPHLDKKHVVIGEVVEGLKVLDAIEEVGGNKKSKGKPLAEVKIYNCGVLS